MKKRVISLCLVVMLLLGMLPFGVLTAMAEVSNTGTLYAYPEFDPRIERDYMYSVSVTDKNGTTELPVYNHVEDSRTVRNTVDVTSDEYRRFSTFAFEGVVTVNIKVNRDFTSYSVMPSAKGLESSFDAETGIIRVTLSEPVYFMVRLDGQDSTNLALLADEPETDVPQAGENIRIIEGWTDVVGGILNLDKDNTTVYIAPGAVLNARIKITANNCKVIGRGAIVDPYGDIYNYDEADFYAKGGDYCLIYVSRANDTVIDGVHLLNSRAYNIEVQGEWNGAYAQRPTVTNVKILSSQMSSDGIMFNYYLEDARAERCFVYCGDNALNYEDNATYKDILVGTTCNAIFPQTDVRNSHLEDIYVFRAEDNIINTEYGGTGEQTVVTDHTIKNLYAQDVTSTAGFLYVEATDKGVQGETKITNVCLPKIDGIGDRFYKNTFDTNTGNHKITMVNVYVDGTRISSISTSGWGSEKSGYAIKEGLFGGWGEISYPKGHEFSYSTSTDVPTGTQTTHKVTVNYQNDLNVFVGNIQVYFADPVLTVDGAVYLPYREIKAHLGVGASADVAVIDGVEYINANLLTTPKMAESVTLSGNRLTVKPINTGDDLLVADSGISRYTEYRPSHQYISAKNENGATVYYVTDEDHSDREGVYRIISEEIQKFGAGTYTLSFDVKTSNSATKLLTTAIDYGTQLDSSNNGKLAHVDTALTNQWQTVTLSFNVTEALLSQRNLSMVIYDRDKTLDDFAMKNVRLTKSGSTETAYQVTWRLGENEITQKWISGVVPQIDFEIVDNGDGIFRGWDRPIEAVTADQVYVALYKSVGVSLAGAQVRVSDQSVRLVGLIDDYQLEGLEELGFELYVGSNMAQCQITKVYTSILANGQVLYADEENPDSNTKFFTFCLYEVPAGTEFEVRAYAVVNGQRTTTAIGKYIFTGNDVVKPGLNLREDNRIEDTATFDSLFG